MVNPQERLDQGVLTQYSELSDLSSDQSSKHPPTKFTMKAGNKLLQVQMGVETPSSTSSSSPSFKSPGSASTLTMVTQPDEAPTVVANETISPPVVKRQLAECVKRMILWRTDNNI